MKKNKLIFINTLLLTSTEFLTRLMGLALIMLVSRYLGPELMGIYSFGVIFVGIFEIFVNFGLQPFILREVGRNSKISNTLFSQVFYLKLIIFVIVTFFITGINLLIIENELKRRVVWILTLTMFFSSNFSVTNAFFRAHLKVKYESIARLLSRILNISVGCFVILSGHGLTMFVIFGLFSQGLACCLVWNIYINKIGNPFHTINKQSLINLVGSSWNFLFIRIIQTVYNSIDALMLSVMVGDLYLGLYYTIVRLVNAFDFIPNGLSGVFLPVLSKSSQKNMPEFISSFKYYFKFQCLLGAGLSAVFLSLSEELLSLIFGQKYMAAVPALTVLSLSIIFLFVNWALSTAIIAFDQEHRLLTVYCFCAGFNIILNLILIPGFKELGTASSTIASQFIFIMCQCKILGPDIRKNLGIAFNSISPLVTGVLTFFIIKLLGYFKFSLPFILIVSFVSFFILTIMTRTFSLKELAIIKGYSLNLK